MSQIVKVEKSDGTTKKYTVHDSRLSPLRDFLKAVKMDDFGGTWSKANSEDLGKAIPPGLRVALESGKKYLLSQARLDVLETYLTNVKGTAWDKSWGTKESTLFAGFSDDIAKDGT